MALTPNHWDHTSIEVPFTQHADWTEITKAVSVVSGYYRSPGSSGTTSRSKVGGESILLENTRSVINWLDTEIRRDTEEWVYERPKGPPLAYKRETKSNCYLPTMGRQFRTVEKEEIEYFNFSALTDGDNLGRIRRLSALVVYTLPVEPDKDASSESKAKALENQMKPGDKEDRVVSTGKIWSEATHDGNIIPEGSAPQGTKWIENVIEEHDIVIEQVDRWIIWTIIKNALQPGDVEVKGPRDVRKTGHRYEFPFPIEPPKLKASKVLAGIKVEVKGGGAFWVTPYFHQEVSCPADTYNFYRKKITEPDRSADDDKYDRWDTPPEDEDYKILTNTDVTDFSGAAANEIPAATSYSEPGDVDPPDEDVETAFELIATVANENIDRRNDQGYAEFVDEDVESGGEYEYYATAVIADSESPDSNHEIVTAGVSTPHRMRMRVFDGGADIIPPDDPTLPPGDFGEVPPPFEIPTDDVVPIMPDIGERQFDSGSAHTVTMDVLLPLLGLEYGQTVQTPVVQWDAWANDIHLETETDGEDWMLVGFTLRSTRSSDGTWTTQRTSLTLQERTP
jgi:hypothetical protein